ncbi:transposase family protein [Streptomyces sp. NPDC048254]|uniref:transposase family protein n=1 Tax=Streptomyces sp. NPDC048254 TaxID=3365525 RepID=UPI00371D7FA7
MKARFRGAVSARWRSFVAASSRNYRFSANVQVVVDADTRLEIAAARPVPGTTADAHAWLSRHCEVVTVLGDGAYLNCGMAVPHRKRPGRALLQAEEDDNADHHKVRARVEHVIGRMKNYKILRDCRQRGDGLHRVVQAVAHMRNLALPS